VLKKAGQDLGVPAKPLTQKYEAATIPVTNKRVGMYQRYYGGNADEGWTRFIFDNWEFPYETIMDADIKAGNLNDRFDVIILPSDYKDAMVDLSKADRSNPRMQMFFTYYAVTSPPEYRSGFGEAGVEALKIFVQNGGRLVTFGLASEFAIDALKLGIRDVVKNKTSAEYYSHGDTFKAVANTKDPLSWGMPKDFLAFSWDSPVYAITERFNTDKYRVVASYVEKDVLQSGWLVGENLIAGKPAMIAASYGKGEAVMIGFRPQHRGQTHGTYKFVFNCLY